METSSAATAAMEELGRNHGREKRETVGGGMDPGAGGRPERLTTRGARRQARGEHGGMVTSAWRQCRAALWRQEGEGNFAKPPVYFPFFKLNYQGFSYLIEPFKHFYKFCKKSNMLSISFRGSTKIGAPK